MADELSREIERRVEELGFELVELERASVLPNDQVASDTVQMGSTVTYETESGQTRTVTLVYPGEADIEQAKVSILTPIGVALLGLAPGQAIDWRARDGQSHQLKVVEVQDDAFTERA